MFNRNKNISYGIKRRMHKNRNIKPVFKPENNAVYKRRASYVNKIPDRLLHFYFILFIITLFIVGYTLNRIELHILMKQVKAQGIDYDSFREMRLPAEVIKNMKDIINEEEIKSEDLKGENKQSFEAADYLTLNMLLNGYRLNQDISLRKNNIKYLLENLSYNKSFMELKEYYDAILKDIACFPAGLKSGSESEITFSDTWNSYRSYGGNRRHEGTDLMPEKNIRGFYPVISMTDGTVEKMGWLEQGGYRVGIRGTAGAYYYYAHLDSYAPGLEIGDSVKAGQFLGYMGDSGYGAEGTVGMFEVHLHIGIYVETDFGELSVNPYWILCYLKNIQ